MEQMRRGMMMTMMMVRQAKRGRTSTRIGFLLLPPPLYTNNRTDTQTQTLCVYRPSALRHLLQGIESRKPRADLVFPSRSRNVWKQDWGVGVGQRRLFPSLPFVVWHPMYRHY
jgi:hypothetical protein